MISESTYANLLKICRTGTADQLKKVLDPLPDEEKRKYINGWGHKLKPLMAACEEGNVDTTAALLKAGASGGCMITDFYGWTVLIYACRSKRPSVRLFEILLADDEIAKTINKPDNDETTPLFVLQGNKNASEECIRFLKEHGAQEANELKKGAQE